jgi:Putative zinc-finger
MNCRHVAQRLSSHLEGLLPAQEAAKLTAHLKACPACRRLRDEFVAMRAELRDLAEPLPPAGLRHRAVQQWIAEREMPARASGRWFAGPSAMPSARRAAGVAFMLVLALLGSAFIRWGRDRVEGLPAPKSAMRQPAGERPAGRRLALARRQTTLRAATPWKRRRFAGIPFTTSATQSPGSAGRSMPAGRRRSQHPALPTFSARDTTIYRRRGDLASPSGRTGPEMRLSRSTPTDDWEQIEDQVRRAIRVRDDFVRVPFPRVASIADRQIAEAVESYKREAAIVDPRLSHEVTCAYKATALSDLCDQLRSDTGIQLSAGPSVADEKVTLFCEKRPLRDVMRQLSRPFGYTWLRSGKASEYRYELVQDLKSQLLEEELRNQDRNQALLDMEEQAKRYRPYLDLSPEEALARAATARPEEKEILKHYAGKGWGPAQMYSRLTPADMAALRAGQRLTFSASPAPGEQPLPPDLARNVIASLRDYHIVREGDRYKVGPVEFIPEGVVPAAVPEAQPIVCLDLIRSELGQISLQGWSGFFIGTPPDDLKADLMGDGERMIATGISPAVRSPRNAVVNAALANDPALRPRISVHLQSPRSADPAPSPVAAGAAKGTAEAKVTSADVLEALHRATGMSIVSDYYTRLFRPEEVSVQNQPLFDALNHLADAMRMRWRKEAGVEAAARSGAGRGSGAGDWLQFRTTSYFNDRLKEVPNRLLSRWAAARRRNGALTVEELVEIAQLSDAQLDSRTVAEGARLLYGLAEWQLAGARQHWRYLAGFTPEQRRAAQSAAGLPFRQMSLAQQQRFLSLALDSSSVRLDSLQELAEGGLQVEYLPPVGFQLQAPKTGSAEERGLDAPRARGQTREAALQAAQRIDPNVTPAQIVPAEMSVTFTYRLGGPNARLTPMIVHLDTHNFVTRRPQPVQATR